MRTPNVMYYAVFVSVNFVLDTIHAWCKDIPWPVVYLRFIWLPKMTNFDITSLHCFTFYSLNSLCILLLQMCSIFPPALLISFFIHSFLSFPSFLLSSLSLLPSLILVLISFFLSSYPLLQTFHMPVLCIVVFNCTAGLLFHTGMC